MTTLYRLVMQYAQVPNVWNYGVQAQLPLVLDKHKGPALPLFTGISLEMVLTKLKAAAENQTPMGLKMKSLDFIVTVSDEVLTMRDATAKCIYQKHGMNVPEFLKDVVVTNSGSSSELRYVWRLRSAHQARARPAPSAERRMDDDESCGICYDRSRAVRNLPAMRARRYL